MSEPRRHIFPTIAGGVEPPPWMRGKRSPDVEAESLVDRLQGGGAHAGRPREHKHRDSMLPPPGSVADTRIHPDDLHAGLAGDVTPSSRFPPPPSLGALVPGGRSNPPPANDVASEHLDERIKAFADAAVELAIARSSTLEAVEGQLLDLSLEIAKAVIEREVEFAPELHSVLVRAALKALGDTTRITLRTSEEAFVAITKVFGGESVDVRGVHVQIIADASLPGLGCIVDGEHVRVDATVAERLRTVRRAFEDERRRKVESNE